MAATKWYCIRTIPGAQRMAPSIDAANDENETEEKKAERKRRKGESIIERNLRNEGIDVYMPAFWSVVQHQRTNRMMEKRFPFLVGYAFVSVQDGDWERVRKVDGVMCVMRPTPERGPYAFRDTDIGALMFAEFERQKQYEIEREGKIQEAQKHRRNALNKRLGLILPKGRRKKVPLRMMAEAAIDSLKPSTRQQVLLILNELKAMDNEMDACRSSSIDIYSAA